MCILTTYWKGRLEKNCHFPTHQDWKQELQSNCGSWKLHQCNIVQDNRKGWTKCWAPSQPVQSVMDQYHDPRRETMMFYSNWIRFLRGQYMVCSYHGCRSSNSWKAITLRQRCYIHDRSNMYRFEHEGKKIKLLVYYPSDPNLKNLIRSLPHQRRRKELI